MPKCYGFKFQVVSLQYLRKSFGFVKQLLLLLLFHFIIQKNLTLTSLDYCGCSTEN